MEEQGLYKLGGLVLVALLVAAALAYATSGGRTNGDAPGRADPPVRVAQAPRPEAGDAVCVPEGAPRPLGDDLRESSGVAVSRAHAGIFWTHNDSGDPLLYAVDSAGRTAGRVRVAGASVQDWEDIALAPCPAGGDCLYVADIGDNDAARASITVYRVPEPRPGDRESAPAAALRLRYPDGPHDAEAMFVLDGAIHVVTKGESGPIALYRAPADARGEAALEKVRELSPEKADRPARITGAAASADGRWIALRTLREAQFHRASELAGGAAGTPRVVDLRQLDERQGEGIGFAPDGSVILTSEGGAKNQPATFSRLSCTIR